jgi:arabinogalactan oligomer/maltooligosaccharide transport system permease protein
MKRLTVAALLALLLVSCTKEEKRIMVWSSLRPVEQTLLDSLLLEFGRDYPGYEFRQLFYAPEEARINYILSALAGKGPDLLHGASDNIGPLSELQLIQPLEDLFEKSFLDSFITTPFPANTWFHGHMYQVADRIGNHLCLVYNKALVPEPPRTVSELIALGDKFNDDLDGDGRPDRYALAWNYTEPYFAVPFIGGYGGWFVDEENNPTLDTEATRKAAQLIYDLANKYKVIPRECDYEISNALFKDGLAAMVINGPWAWGTYLSEGIDIGLARIPVVDETGLNPTPIVSPLGYSVNINTTGERLEITRKLVRFLTAPEVQIRFSKQVRTIPTRREAYKDPFIRSNVLLHQAIDQMNVGKPMPVDTKIRWIWDAMRPAYQGIFTGQLTPDQAARDMQQRAEKLIRENL